MEPQGKNEAAENKKSETVEYSRLTMTDLKQTDVFFESARPDAWGVVRAPFSPQIARMSAEMAANGYDVEIGPWVRAGWSDITFVIEDRIVPLDRDSDSRLAAIEGEWKRHRAKSLIHGVRPIGDLLRAARQLLVTDMGKAIVMTHALPDGRVILSISFIGTTQKFFDWFSNFKFQPEEGMHYGFLMLARQFDALSERIQLPGLAQALGRESLTLAQALSLSKDEGERFAIWLSGHSQGGALVQTYTHLLLKKGIDPSRLRAYSFAAPTVTVVGGLTDPKAYPVYNIVNTDDMVARIGAQARLGQDLLFWPNDAFRDAHYRVETECRAAYVRLMYFSNLVQSTREAACFGIALMRMLAAAESDAETGAFFTELVPFLSMLDRVGLGKDEIASFLLGKIMENYRVLIGGEPDSELVGDFGEKLRDALREFGAKSLAKALQICLFSPHRLRPDKRFEGFMPPYLAIVRRHLSELQPGVWLRDPPPRLVTATGETLLPRNWGTDG